MKILFSILIIMLAFSCYSQEKTTSKVQMANFKVEGVCGMCEKRIESALDIVGIKRADWDLETSMITVIYNPKKITEDEMHQILADAGHRTSKKQKSKVAYEKFPNCCKYDDGVEKH